MEIETGMQPRNGAAISQGLLRVRKFSERKTADHFLELQKLRMEVEDAQYHADLYHKKYYDSTRREWKHLSKLQPNSLVWLETRTLRLPTDAVQKVRKMRPRRIGPCRIIRRRRHWTFELDMGPSRLHNIYHISMLTPYEGDCAEAQALEDVEVRDPGASQAYEVERILAHRGKHGTAQHMFLVKWKGYLPEKSTWVRAEDINADAAIAEYEREVKARLDYWQGIVGPLASDEPADGTTVADRQAWTDAAVCSLTADLRPPMLDWACSMWTDRARHSAW